MILTCPECGTSYFVDDARIPANGRSVKCSSCDARWVAMPEAAPAAAPAPPKPAPPPASFEADDPFLGDLEVVDPADIRFAPTPPVRGSRRKAKESSGGKVTILLCAALVVAVVVAVAIIFRDAVVSAFPEAEAAYAGAGLPVDSLGLAIENVKVEPTFEGGRPVLAVGGSIRNTHDEGVVAPPLRINLLDRTGKVVAAKIVKPLDGAIPARGTRHFAVTIADPPASVHDLEITFEAPEAGTAAEPVHAAVAAAEPAPGAHPAAPEAAAPAEAKPLPAGSPDALSKHD